MKFSRKFLVTTSFVLGIVLLSTSAFADMILNSGYSELKQALKDTYLFAECELDESYTGKFSISLKDGETLLFEESNTVKYDLENNRYEALSTSYDAYRDNSNYSHFNYEDANMWLYINSDGDKRATMRSEPESYDVSDRFSKNYYSANIENIFETEEAKDLEGILDAFVGSLSSLVQMEDTGDYIIYQGGIDSTQIPAYANAIASFLVKNTVFDSYRRYENSELPHIKGQVYFSQINGRAIECKDGYISDLIASAVLMGTDEDGMEHSFSVDFYFSISDLGTTTIDVPDISDAEVTELKGEKKLYKDIWSRFYPEDAGTYVSGISERVDGDVRFIGTRTLTIDSVDEDGTITGTFSVDYTDDTNEQQKDFSSSFVSDAKTSTEWGYHALFEYTDANGETKYAVITRNDETTISICHDVNVSYGEKGTVGISWDEDPGMYSRIK